MDKQSNVFRVNPEGAMEILSRREVSQLRDTRSNGLHELFRRCSLAVLNSGNPVGDGRELLRKFPDFDLNIEQLDRGIKLEIHNAPASAFVDGEMILGIREHLFSVVRDIVYVHNQIRQNTVYDLDTPGGISNAVFHILRNARALRAGESPNLVVCWGGHSISRDEYDYTKQVGYELGLRRLDVCTGCGPGAMKGPMKGAMIGHAKQRRMNNRYIGISEPGIIAAESPNPVVNSLVIMPDIEKRLEAFVRLGHGIVVFPGGAGTTEEILYLLGILLHPENEGMALPLVFTGPHQSRSYFEQVHDFIGATLGADAQKLYSIVIDNPGQVGTLMKQGLRSVLQYREHARDAFFFNWKLEIRNEFQQPFAPTHENMSALNLHKDQPTHLLAADLRRAFSGIVAGNVKESGLRAIDAFGPYEIHGDRQVIEQVDALLASFVRQHRMKLEKKDYTPCYHIRK